MFAYPLRTAALTICAAVGLAGCMGPYGYGGVSAGAGNGYYGSGYGYGAGYPGYGYGAGYPGYASGYGFDPYWGWNDGYYYPGTGYYVYDRDQRRHSLTAAQRRYWELRRQRALSSGKQIVIRDNWGDFANHIDGGDRTQATTASPAQVQTRRVIRSSQVERSKVRAERRSARAEQSKVRAERSSERAQRQSEVRSADSDRSRGNRRENSRQD